MGFITDIKEQKRRKDRLSIFVDGRYTLSMSQLSLQKAGLKVGQELSQGQVRELDAQVALGEALHVAKRSLAHRPQSEAEIRSRLRRRGLVAETIEGVGERLKELGLLDDSEFAQFWKENRMAFRPRSKRLLAQELRQKGVDREIIEEVSADMDDGEEAYRAGLKKARSLPHGDYKVFDRRMLTFLSGRGFGYTTASQTVKRLWMEVGEQEDA